MYQLNLIDTPGTSTSTTRFSSHCRPAKGALLLVDASQGVEAQTVVNAHLADRSQPEVLPVLNKMDLPHARADEVAMEIEDAVCIPKPTDAVAGVREDRAENVCQPCSRRSSSVIPAPTGDSNAKLQALIFDAVYDEYRGVVVYLRVFHGTIARRATSSGLMGTGKVLRDPSKIGRLRAEDEATNEGYCTPARSAIVISNIKQLCDVVIGDTMTASGQRAGSRRTAARAFEAAQGDGALRTSTHQPRRLRVDLRDALEKLRLNDSSVRLRTRDISDALGFGFRCGFLGLLHMEIIQQRLEREDDMDLVQTAPNGARTRSSSRRTGEVIGIHSPRLTCPTRTTHRRVHAEPVASRCNVVVPIASSSAPS